MSLPFINPPQGTGTGTRRRSSAGRRSPHFQAKVCAGTVQLLSMGLSAVAQIIVTLGQANMETDYDGDRIFCCCQQKNV